MEIIQRKICLLGDFAVGKTSLVRRFVYNKFESDYQATIGVNISRKEIYLDDSGKRKAGFVLWDLAGGETFTQMEESYYRGGAGAVLVADATRQDTFGLLNTYATTFTQINPGASLVIMFNKGDLLPDITEVELTMREISARWGAPCFVTSALTGACVEQAFRELAQLVTR